MTRRKLLVSEGVYYPVLQQDAGLANIHDAMTADPVITMAPGANAGAADGKVKVELFDDRTAPAPTAPPSPSATWTTRRRS